MQREISAILGKGKVVLRETGRAVTPYGGMAVMAEYLKKIGYAEQLRQAMPIETKSPNAIPPVDIYTAFLVAVLAGARRFAHASRLRGDSKADTDSDRKQPLFCSVAESVAGLPGMGGRFIVILPNN